jgi:hypothetical protein
MSASDAREGAVVKIDAINGMRTSTFRLAVLLTVLVATSLLYGAQASARPAGPSLLYGTLMTAHPAKPGTGRAERKSRQRLDDLAIDWAQAQLGAIRTSENRYSNLWSGYCEAFVEAAFGYAFRYYDALADYDAQMGQHRVRGGVPPRGVLVFYSSAPYGHVALSTGAGWVITTVGLDGQRLPVMRHRYDWFAGRYLGWAPAPVPPRGFRVAERRVRSELRR